MKKQKYATHEDIKFLAKGRLYNLVMIISMIFAIGGIVILALTERIATVVLAVMLIICALFFQWHCNKKIDKLK